MIDKLREERETLARERETWRRERETIDRQSAPVTVRRETIVEPPPVVTERTVRDYVPYPQSNGEAEALREAMRMTTRHYPGAGAYFNHVEQTARQILGGKAHG